MTTPKHRPVLGFDTSGPYCAVAVVHQGVIRAVRHEDRARGQAERLLPLLEDVLADAATDWASLAAIGVGIGPGNFTGIRISVAAARGLALSLGIPAIGVSDLEALAHGIARPCIATLPAPRGAFYVQIFTDNTEHVPVLMTLDGIRDAGFPGDARCVGIEADKIATASGGTVVAAAPLAVSIAQIAEALQKTPQLRPTPLYLRPADAAPAKDQPPDLIP